MSENGQAKPQNSESDGVSATINVATVMTSSDKLIVEDINEQEVFFDPTLQQFGMSGSSYVSDSDDEDEQQQDEALVVEKKSNSKKQDIAPDSPEAAASTASIGNTAIKDQISNLESSDSSSSDSESSEDSVDSFIEALVSIRDEDTEVAEAADSESSNDNSESSSSIDQIPEVLDVDEAGLLSSFSSAESNDDDFSLNDNGQDILTVEIVNFAPSDIKLSSNSVQENTSTSLGSIKVANISIIDDQYGLERLTLTGQDADKLEIQGSGNTFTLHIKQGVVLDFESQNTLSFNVTATDIGNSALSITKSFSINITNINEEPDATNSNLTIDEDSSYYFSTADFGFSDEDSDNLASVIISQLPGEGSLQLYGTDITTNQEISVADIGNLTFTPLLNRHGSETLNFRVTDGELASEEHTLTLNITSVADEPQLNPGDHTQLFLSDFETDAGGWQTDNPSSTLERNPETAYGGSDAGNTVLEVEAAAGDSNIYRTVSTESGKVYQLNFEFSPRQGYSDSTIDVIWGGNTVATLDGSSGTFGWQSHSLTLSGNGSDMRLEFKATDQNGVGGLLNDIGLVELYATALEDHPVAVDINSSLVDQDGSESFSLAASGIPSGAVLSDGVNTFTASAQESSINISGWDASQLTLTPPQHFNGDFDITYSATSTEADTGLSSTITETVTVTILSVDDPLLVNNEATTTSVPDSLLVSSQSVLANDSDADSTISVVSVNNQAVAASGTSRIEGAFGVLNINAKGQWSYTPDTISSAALNVTASDLQTSLVAHWQFDEGSGSTVADSSSAGSQNDTASLSGNAGFNTAGVSGSAITLDGSNGQVLIPDSADINTLASLPARSISLAFNLDSNNSLTGRQILYEEGASVNGIAIYIENQTLYVGAYNKTTGWDGNYASHDISALSKDAWHHVALVLDDANNTLTAYLDGSAFPGGNVYGEAISSHTGDISIGGPSLDGGSASTNIFHDGEATGGYFSGSIDDVRIYNRVLADSEVEAVRYDFDLLAEQFQYTVASDQEEAVASLVINVTRSPIAIDGVLSLGEDDLYTSGQLQASDYDAGDTLSYELVSGPDKGFVTLNTDGSYSFLTGNDFQSLADGESEQVSFSYRVSDNFGNQDTGSVQVMVSGADEPLQGSNLVTNPSAATGDLSGWTVSANGGNGWGITGTSQEGINGFITSYDWDRKYQLIDLQANGYSTEDLDSAPDIYASEWYLGIANTSDSYYFRVELRDASQSVIDSFNTGTLTASGSWQEVSHTFSGYGAGVRYIYVEHGGKDAEYWAGHYGAVIDNTQIIVDLPENQPDNQNIVGIQNSQLLIQDGVQSDITLNGGIVENSGFTSIDQWYLNHQGGGFTLSAETTDGASWLSGFRLFSAELNGQVGVELGSYSVDIPASGSSAIISLADLPTGHYMLAVGNEGFSESEGVSVLDYANSALGNHDYQLVIAGNTDIQTMPRDPGDNAQIQSQTYASPDAQIQFTVDFNSASMATDTNYHFELLDGDTRLSQGQATFPADQSSVEITAAINSSTLASITMDDVRIRFYEVDVSGQIQDSQTFEFAAASVPDGGAVTPVGGDGLQGTELIDLGLAVFDLSFSEIMDDMQNPMPG